MSQPSHSSHSSVSILFVCTANRVRSPYAEAVARRLIVELGLPVQVGSAGFLAPDHPADRDMAQVARRRGVDLATHRSRQVDQGLLDRSDLIVAMTGQHVIDLVGLAPDAARRMLTLRELAAAVGTAPLDDWAPDAVRRWADAPTRRPIQQLLDGRHDIADPIGRSMRHYRAAADEIESLVAVLFAPRSTRGLGA